MINIIFALLVTTPYCDVMKDKSFYLSEYRQKTVCQNIEFLKEKTKEEGIRDSLMVALIYVESGWKKTVVSTAGACGLTQVLPKYTGKITRRYTCKQLKNPRTSIGAGVKILRWWINYHSKNQPRGRTYTDEEIIKRSLCSYNAGFRCGAKQKPSRGGMRYAKKVLSVEKKIKSLNK